MVQALRLPLACALLLAAVGAAGAGAAPPACFAPGALAARPGEEVVQPRRTNVLLPARALPPVAPAPAGLAGSIRRVDLPAGVKLVALTFDLCEAGGEISGYDGAIFDYLRQESVPTTLFVGGKWMMTHQERAMQLIADPLFEVGNHSWSHANLTVRTGTEMQRQVDDADIAYAVRREDAAAQGCGIAGPARTALFRFPYGSCSAEALGYVNRTGHLAIQWDVDSGDPAFIGAKGMAEAMLAAIRPGSIVLMHANGRGRHTAQAIRLLIPALKAKGYRFATVSELLAAGKPVIAPTCYSLRPGDTKVYDDAARQGRRVLAVQ
ncbi:polysaccharide deacetylase family protein [Xanthobacter sp. KR7-225]|uniref:polysaccharide deacetylase family protein n=1 Tax=Xanthobacter sp. KR7-225 TaxID=3156613 RepID=UPI0032B37196